MAEKIDSIALHEAAQTRYLNYALSVITSRALPDVRDGLKPVQRRILYAMYSDLKLTKDAKHRKSAAVVGGVMAKYHPHGDQSIYDALVRMAQDFSLRYPLVDGQGNFGSLDGDSAAAMRYTEARLQAIAEALLGEIGQQTIDWRPNYDGQFSEPVVVPAQVPNLLLNGAMGIAVGMATNIPPHNLRELIRACVKMIDKPETTGADLMRIIKGPDFPTGGRLLNTEEELADIYEKGRGALKIIGEYEVEEEGDQRRIVVTSIPWTVNKAQLVEKIAEHIRSGALPQLVDVRDESTDVIRVVMDLAKGASPRAAMAYVFKNTPLEMRFHVNMTCLVPVKDENSGETTLVPARLPLWEVLRHFLDFRFEVVERRIQYELARLKRRIKILEAFEAIFGALDEALAIIRSSDGRKDAAQKLGARFELDEEQVQAVLDARLYKLAKMEIEAIQKELAEKRDAADGLQALLDSPEARWDLIKEELRATARTYGDKRRTSLGDPDEALEFDAEDYIVREDAVVVVTREGWIKRQRSYSDISKLRVRDNDEVGWVFWAMTHHALILFTNRGQAYTMRIDSVPATSGYGEPVQAHFDFADGEKIVGVACTDPRFSPGATLAHWEEGLKDVSEYLLVALTRGGNGVRFAQAPYETPSTRAGRMYIRLKDRALDGLDDGVVGVKCSEGNENVCLASREGRALIFPVSDLTIIKGRGRGVTAINLEGKDAVLDFCLSTQRLEGLEVETNRGRKEIVRTTKFPVARRGRKGRPIILRGFIADVTRKPFEIDRPELATSSSSTSKASQAIAAKPAVKPVAEPEAEPAKEEAPETAPPVAARSLEVVYNDSDASGGPDPEPVESGEPVDQMKLF